MVLAAIASTLVTVLSLSSLHSSMADPAPSSRDLKSHTPIEVSDSAKIAVLRYAWPFAFGAEADVGSATDSCTELVWFGQEEFRQVRELSIDATGDPDQDGEIEFALSLYDLEAMGNNGSQPAGFYEFSESGVRIERWQLEREGDPEIRIPNLGSAYPDKTSFKPRGLVTGVYFWRNSDAHCCPSYLVQHEYDLAPDGTFRLSSIKVNSLIDYTVYPE